MRIRTGIEFSGVPAGTTGNAERDHEAEKDWAKGKTMWVITWDLERNKPLRDWFDQEEFDKWLEVI